MQPQPGAVTLTKPWTGPPQGLVPLFLDPSKLEGTSKCPAAAWPRPLKGDRSNGKLSCAATTWNLGAWGLPDQSWPEEQNRLPSWLRLPATSIGKGGLGGRGRGSSSSSSALPRPARVVLVHCTQQHLEATGRWSLWASKEAEEALNHAADFWRCGGSRRRQEKEPRGGHLCCPWKPLWPWILVVSRDWSLGQI